MTEHSAAGVSEWATKSGSLWARRWRDTDRGLSQLAPYLLRAILDRAPGDRFRAFDIGCGPGSTTIELATVRPDAEITACDVSADLAEIARQRTAGLPQVHVVEGDAEILAGSHGPFDMLFSRHGVMFFPDPVEAFGSLRKATVPGGSIVFSCFQSWEANPWASQLAAAAAGRELTPPGREPSGFAFANPHYMREIFYASGWDDVSAQDVRFDYRAAASVEDAMSFFLDIGPGARVVQELPEDRRGAAVDRMRNLIEQHFDGNAVAFPAAAWIWSARAN
jgi:SAM-dependent methyltransferase